MSDRIFVKYKISIVRVDQVDTIERKYEKVADSGNKQDGKTIYDYVTHPGIAFHETTILTQEIREEKLDIKAVIKAINGM